MMSPVSSLPNERKAVSSSQIMMQNKRAVRLSSPRKIFLHSPTPIVVLSLPQKLILKLSFKLKTDKH